MSSPTDASSARHGPELLLGAALVALAACVAFAVSLRGGFVWDDVAFLPSTPALQAVRDPRAFFSAGIWAFAKDPVELPLYRPAVALALWALAPLLGGSPLGWHAFAVALHALDAVLVLLLVRRVLPQASRFAALAAGLVFALHPVHAEAVAWIMAFGHPLAAAFALAAAHAQVSHARGGGHASLVAAAVAAAAACLASEGALVVPPLLVALEWIVRGERPRPRVLAACAGTLAVVIALRARALHGSTIPLRAHGQGLGTAASFALAYLRHLVLPWPQRAYMSVPPGGMAGPVDALAALAGLGAAAALVARAPRGQRRFPAFALAWILAGIAPLVAAALNPAPLFAPRALYLPSIGLALLVAWAARSVEGRTAAPRAALAAATAVGLLASAAASAEWRDDMRVHERFLEVDPGFAPAHQRIARLLGDRGDVAGAIAHLEAAVRTARNANERLASLEELAVRHGRAGRIDEAERLLSAVVTEAPERATAWIGLGTVAFTRGDLPAARAAYERAAHLKPDSYEAAWDLALVLEAQGEPAAAAALRSRAAALAPAAP